MRTNKKLAIENLERRKVFSGVPGLESGITHDPVFEDWASAIGIPPHVTLIDPDDIDVLSVDSSRDAASGLPTGKRTSRLDAANIDGIFVSDHSIVISSQTEMTHSRDRVSSTLHCEYRECEWTY